jgi:hypothetical protein
MFIFEEVLRDLLIRANLVERRVFLVRAPQAPASQQKTPYFVYFHIAPTIRHSHLGPIGLYDRDYQVSIFDPSQSKALAIADSLRSYLDGMRGDFEGISFGGIFHRNQAQHYEDDTKLYHILQEYRIQYRLPADLTAVNNRSNDRTTNRSKSE